MIQITLAHLLKRCADKFPGKQGLVCEKGRWSFAQWEENATRLAGALADLGVGSGEHVATLFVNGQEVLQTYPALWKLGAVVIPLNTRMTPREMAQVIDHCQATTLIYGPGFAQAVEEMRGQTPGVKRWLACQPGPDPDLIDLMQRQALREMPIRASEEDVACILYTAGTTGLPKGVILTHRNCLWAAVNLAQDSQFARHHRILLVFPLFHAAAFSMVTTSLYLGCTLVSMAQFSPQSVMETVERERLSKLAFPPTVWNFILQLPDLERYDTSSVESISSGGSAMPQETKRKLKELFPQAKLGETYGMTETAAAITTLGPGEGLGKPSCVGRAFTNLEVLVADDQGQALGPGQVGEVVVRGPNVMQGYYRDPEETSRTLKDSWLHTGDLGYLDGEGLLYLVDRKKDMIISGGENIYPREVEEVLFSHPAVADAAVIGMPDPVWGERVHGVIVIKPGEALSEPEIIEFCKSRLATYKKPRSVEFVDSIPRSPAGKALKNKLRHARS